MRRGPSVEIHEDVRCEWPARIGATLKCGKPAKYRALSEPADPSKWARLVCGVHAGVAERRGWLVLWTAGTAR